MTARLAFLTFLLLLSVSSFSQNFAADTATVARAIANLRGQFYQTKGIESFISIGSDYADYEAIEDEHPFFLDNDWVTGTVKYNDILYFNVPLQYDIRSQKLLTELAASGKKIELVKQHISWFKIGNHHFFFLNTQSALGYYELLEDGNAKLWAAHSKTFQESTVTGKLTVRTEETTKYFIGTNDSLIPVKGKSTILTALEDKREPLRQALKKNKVNFNRNKPAGLIEAVRLYNSIRP
jgi:hypothetical protein